MSDPRREIVGRTAADLAEAVRAGSLSPVDVVHAHLEQIERLDVRIGAFERICASAALGEADALEARHDLSSLPLAGVPVAVKDNIPVRGEPVRYGSTLSSDAPAPADHEVVRRIRDAGGIILGITRIPELGIWGAADGAFGVARNPWNLDLTPGGSSGGSAAAVAAALVPVAHGNDGLGSIRIPAAACGVVGFKPGVGVVPSGIGRTNWYGISENGPLATTVTDAALLLSVMAGRPELTDPRPVDRSLRVALSTRSPVPMMRIDPAFVRGAVETAELLAGDGHEVDRADPPYGMGHARAITSLWFAAAAAEAEGMDTSRLQAASRGHIRAGKIARRLGWVRPEQSRAKLRRAAGDLFRRHDLLVTPALATTPIEAEGWSRKGWLANMSANSRFAPFAALWNLAGYPAVAVPAGVHATGVPLSVQLVAPEGREELLLSIAHRLEELRPWPRHAPTAV